MLIPTAVARLHRASRSFMSARRVCMRPGPWSSRPARNTAGRMFANLATYEGPGVCYWASPIEAKLCPGEEIVLVGGGNSAGQAAVFLVLRREGSYPGDAARNSPREHVALSRRAHRRLLRDRAPCSLRKDHGALRHTRGGSRLPACAGWIAAKGGSTTAPRATCSSSSAPTLRRPGSQDVGSRSTKPGFVLTGAEVGKPAIHAANQRGRRVRSGRCPSAGSVKRVGNAIGEGAQVVAALHGFLADAMKPSL